MNFLQIYDALNRTDAPAAGKAVKLPSGLYLLRWGSGIPTGTPDANYYFNTDITATADQMIYVNLNGVWTGGKLAT